MSQRQINDRRHRFTIDYIRCARAACTANVYRSWGVRAKAYWPHRRSMCIWMRPVIPPE